MRVPFYINRIFHPPTPSKGGDERRCSSKGGEGCSFKEEDIFYKVKNHSRIYFPLWRGQGGGQRKALIFLIILFLLTNTNQINAQCFTVSDTNPCGGEIIDFQINTPNDSTTYTWNFGDGSDEINGETVSHQFAGNMDLQTYTVSVTSEDETCAEAIDINVAPAPDATITNPNGNSFFINCINNSNNTDYELEIINASNTLTNNTYYTINWGDGSPVYENTDFTALSHTYPLGYFLLTVTVTGDSSFGACDSTTIIYEVFNGSNPAVGISNTGGNDFYCAGATIPIGIQSTDDNPPSTTYEIYINGELNNFFNHPPPALLELTFEESSCGLPDNAYEVTIVADNPCAGNSSASTLINISAPPTFTMPPLQTIVCEGDDVTLPAAIIEIYDSPVCAPDPNGYINMTVEPNEGWELISQNPTTFNFTESGTYTIEVEAANKCDTIEQIHIVEVVSLLETLDVAVNFTQSSEPHCDDNHGMFNNVSGDLLPPGDTMKFVWEVTGESSCWAFLNNTNENSEDIEVDFMCPGNYTVALTANNQCTDLLWDTLITIHSKPEITLDVPPVVCLPIDIGAFVTVNDHGLDLTSELCFIYFSGQPIASCDTIITTLFPNNYSVFVSATNDCGSASDSHNFSVLESNPQIEIEPIPPLCGGEPVHPVANPPGGIWTNTAGDTLAIPFEVVESQQLTYTLGTGECEFSETLNIEVIQAIEVDAGQDLWYCEATAPAGQSLPGLPQGGIWSGEGITPQGVVDDALAPGSYTFTYSVYDAVAECTASDEITLYIENTTPQMNIPSNVCMNELFTFNNLSTFELIDSTQISYEWDFGYNNESSDVPQPQYSYPVAGTYTVTLTARSAACANTISQTIEVGDAPNADFLTNRELCDTTICFESTSVGDALNLSWDFGNGQVSDLNEPCIDFNRVGDNRDYIVSLTVEGTCGITTAHDTVTIFQSPEAVIFTETDICAGGTIEVIGNLSEGYIDDFQWYYDNTLFAATPNAELTLPQVNDVTDIELTLVASNDCEADTVTQTVTVIPTTVEADFTYLPNVDTICENEIIQFFNLSQGDTSVVWIFGNASTAQENPEHTFDESGNTFIQFFAKGCHTDTMNHIIYVRPAPAAEFEAEPTCAGTIVPLRPMNIDAECTYNWLVTNELGEQTEYLTAEPMVDFPTDGMYDVRLTVTDVWTGCADSQTRTVEAMSIPIADFALERDLCALHLSIENYSEGAENYIWTYGDGTTAVGASPESYTYDSEGEYTVSLRVQNSAGCADSMSQTVFFDPVVSSDFTYEMNEDCSEATVNFTNRSENAISYSWLFGDGTASFSMNPTVITYEDKGMYEVSLIAADANGCTDTLTVPIQPRFCNGIAIANAFVPEGHEAINTFKPVAAGLRDYRFEIYSSYGELLWATTVLEGGIPTEGWDGTHNGKLLPQDVYVWKIHGIFEDGTVWQGMDFGDGVERRIGSVTLIR